ncbi:MAG: DNA-directed RNA polymerase sigma-70 factor [Myxococcales bacterium]
MANSKQVTTKTVLDQYFIEINRVPLLSRSEEQELARRLKDDNDPEAGRKLVLANLRFVVKVAFEYRKYQISMLDLIQEGNLGLMTAVQRFDPYRGYRLISYAVWWIKAYIQGFILRTWSLVKLGTTAQQRRMLFGNHRDEDGRDEETVSVLPAIASRSSGELLELDTHIARRDFSLDASLDETARVSYLDMLRDGDEGQEEALARGETRTIVQEHLDRIESQLNERELFILEHRTLSDEPMTLQDIGTHFHVTRERTRQIEAALMRKLARAMPELEGDFANAA